MSVQPILLAQKSWEHSLYENPDGTLHFIVVCGAVGLYDAQCILNEEQTLAYRAGGMQYLDELAAVMRNAHKNV